MFAVLGPLLSLLGFEAKTITAQVRRQAIVWGLIGLFGFVFFCFLLVAANSGLTLVVGAVIAPLIIAIAAAVIALIVYLVFQIQNGIAEKRRAERERGAEATAVITTALLTAAPSVLRSPLLRKYGVPAGLAIAAVLLWRNSLHDDRD